jgi:peptide/nickel transport system permease protein
VKEEGNLASYIARRLLSAVPTLIGISIITFLIIAVAPGDVAFFMMGAEGKQMQSARGTTSDIRSEMGLNDPLPVRYVRWLGQIARGDLGYSLAENRPLDIIMPPLIKLTLQITVPALLLGLFFGVLTGVLQGLRPYSKFDHGLSFLNMSFVATPSFIVALLLIYFLAIRLPVWVGHPIFPSGGSTDIFGMEEPTLWNRIKYFILPVLTMSLFTWAGIARYTRASVIGVLDQDFVRTARSKGLLERNVVVRHILRNALLPVITVAALQIPLLINGAILVETTFGWGGIGSRAAAAVGQRDFPFIMISTMLTAVLVVVANLIADILYSLVDPRVHYQ